LPLTLNLATLAPSNRMAAVDGRD